jgi:Zn-finger nucleic acid-binding protein
MECPSCGVEMVDLAGDDQTLRKCGECGGLWMDVSDLNRMLLHQGLPGLETLGGKVDPDAMSGQCPECQVDLVRVEGGEKNEPLSYDTCESCGGVFIEEAFKDAETFAAAQDVLVDFFTRFSPKVKRKAAGG